MSRSFLLSPRGAFSGAVLALSLTGFAAGAHAAVVFQTPTGATGISGYITVDDRSLPGTSFTHPSFSAANLVDGDLGTIANTYSGTEVSGLGNNTAPLDFIGMTWTTPQTGIVGLRLFQFLFFDGGWFGTQAGDPNTTKTTFPNPTNTTQQNVDDANDVAAPTVQVSSDGGSTWTSLAATDDYVSVIQPEVLNQAGSSPPPVTFDFALQDGVNGIRLVGYGGGRSDIVGGRDQAGWVSARELQVGVFVADVSEPSAVALVAAGLLAAGFASRPARRRR